MPMALDAKARSRAWSYLLVAGAAEVGFTYFLNLRESFAKLGPTLAFVGLGAFGTALVGILAFGDPVTAARVVLILVIVGAVVGLKFYS